MSACGKTSSTRKLCFEKPNPICFTPEVNLVPECERAPHKSLLSSQDMRTMCLRAWLQREIPRRSEPTYANAASDTRESPKQSHKRITVFWPRIGTLKNGTFEDPISSNL